MQNIQQKYENDSSYKSCVDMMVSFLYQNQFTPSEMREMATYACMLYEIHNPSLRFFPITEEVEMSLRLLNKLRLRERDNPCPPGAVKERKE
jgi:hypothetical protein